MNLNEIYEKLLRRGMPWHPRLQAWYGKWYDHNPTLADSPSWPIHPDDARDLIEAHARRWWIDFNNAFELEGHEGRWNLSCVKFWSGEAYCEGSWDDEYCAPTILEAIEAATRHLEPKEEK